MFLNAKYRSESLDQDLDCDPKLDNVELVSEAAAPAWPVCAKWLGHDGC